MIEEGESNPQSKTRFITATAMMVMKQIQDNNDMEKALQVRTFGDRSQ